MSCRDLEKNREDLAALLSGDLPAARERELTAHLESCVPCRAIREELDRVWARLGDDPDVPVRRPWALESERLIAKATLDRRVARFPVRFRPATWMAQAAAVILAAGAGYMAARTGTGTPQVSPGATAPMRTVALSSQKTLDASGILPDLSSRPRLANVSLQPSPEEGSLSISFDLTTRYTIVGRPGEPAMTGVLSYLLSGTALTEGTRGRAIDLVSESARAGEKPAPEVVSSLVASLKSDRNPGVRRKAAEALAVMPSSPEIRDAFLSALKTDGNPAVRIIAIEGLARAARELRDPATIEVLRNKANDGTESEHLRVKAASLLAGVEL